MHTKSALRRCFYRMTGFLLPVLLITGCNRSAQQPAESAAPTEPESAAVESLLRSDADYQKWFHYYVRHSGNVYASDATVYRELRRLQAPRCARDVHDREPHR